MEMVGGLRHLRKESNRIRRIIQEEFGRISPEDRSRERTVAVPVMDLEANTTAALHGPEGGSSMSTGWLSSNPRLVECWQFAPGRTRPMMPGLPRSAVRTLDRFRVQRTTSIRSGTRH